MNILVTGAYGQLGHCIYDIAKGNDIGLDFFYTDVADALGDFEKYFEKLDITDEKAVKKYVKENDIHCIINCAAYTNVDKAESDKMRATILNTVAPSILASSLNPEDLFIHISTDYVFGGIEHNTPIVESTETCPLGVYGKTKDDGEKLLRETKPRNSLIIRTAWLYSEYGKNFLKTIRDLLKSNRDEIKVVYDQVGSPTYAGDLAMAILNIIKDFDNSSKYSETYHFTNEGVCSWYDFAYEIGYYVDSITQINPCLSNEFLTAATRPSYSVLSKSKIKNNFNIDIPYWKNGLDRCIRNIEENE